MNRIFQATVPPPPPFVFGATLCRACRGAVLAAAAAGCLAALVPAAHGQTPVTWGNTATNFNLSSSWLGGSVPTAANIAVFGNSVTQQPSLTAAASVAGLQFGTANWTLGGGGNALTLGSSGLTLASSANASRTINTNITLAADQTWTIANPGGNNNRNLLLNNPAAPASGSVNLTLTGGGRFDLASSGALNIGTSGTLTVRDFAYLLTNNAAVQPSNAGTVLIQSGGVQIALGSAAFGSSSVAPTITIYGNGSLMGGGGGASQANRIRDTAAITLQGGAFAGNSGEARNNTETVGAITLGAGGGRWVVRRTTDLGASTGTITSAAASLTRTADRGTMLFSSAALQIGAVAVGRTEITVSSTAGLTLVGGGGSTSSTTDKNISILPWAVGDNSYPVGFGAGFVTYDSSLGFRLLTTTNYDSSLGTAGNNVRLAADATPTGNQTANALLVDTGGTAGVARTVTGDGALTITSGGLIFGGDSSSTSTVTNTGTIGGFTGLVFGSSGTPAEAVITVSAIHTNTASSKFRTAGTLTISSPITTADGLTKSGPGTLVLASAANAFTGPTTINGGTLRLGASNALPTGTDVAINGSGGIVSGTISAGAYVSRVYQATPLTVLDLNGFNQTVSGLTGADGAGGSSLGVVTSTALGTATLTHTGSSTFAGRLQDGGAGQLLALTKSTGGLLTLSGSNTFTGATGVSGGRLLVTGALGNTAVSVTGSGALGGTGSLGGSLSFAALSAFEIMDFLDPLSVTGSTTFASGFGVANLTGFSWDALDLDTPYAVLATTQQFSLADISNFGLAARAPVGTASREAYFTSEPSGGLQLVVVPEPGTLPLAGLGVAAAALVVRRRGLGRKSR